MSFQIKATPNGPIVLSGDNVLTLSDVEELFDLISEEEALIPEMKVHIANTMVATAQEWSEALIDDLYSQMLNNKLTAYQNAGMYLKTLLHQQAMAQHAAASATAQNQQGA